MNWIKTDIKADTVKSLCSKYGVDAITASIMVRRGIINGSDMWPFMESSTRYLHNPFLFDSMEEAVDRVLDAVNSAKMEDEEYESEPPPKVLVFGDRDVDGITATLIMAGALKEAGCRVVTRVPIGDEPYGISVKAVDDAADAGCTLIVTVDCGISCTEAVDTAARHGIDVIVTDHHNVTGDLPDVAAVIDPKVIDCRYPFMGLSGAGVALKFSYALRFASLAYYKRDITMLDAHTSKTSGGEEVITVECIKTRNMIILDRMTQTVKRGSSIMATGLVSFLEDELIFVWDAKRVKGILQDAFGKDIDFEVTDIKIEVSKIWHQFATKSIEDIRTASRVSLYSDSSEAADALYNIFVTWMWQLVSNTYKSEADDLCLAALSTMADIMPMTDENRIIVKSAVRTINTGHVRRGVRELMSHQALIPAEVTARDLSWTIIPALNACGRMGNSLIALELLSSTIVADREKLAQAVFDMNEERKRLVSGSLSVTTHKAKASLEENDNKMVIVIDGRIAKGITGLVASRFAEQYGVPAIVATFANDKVTGSLRSLAGFSCTEFLSHISSLFTADEDTERRLFIDYGGHNSAAGFSIKKDMLDEFLTQVKVAIKGMKEAAPLEEIKIDAEIPARYINLDLLKVVDFFSPFGTGNEELLFMTKGLPVCNAIVVGRGERQHLKMTLDASGAKCPAMIWGGADLLGKRLNIGDTIDVLYSMTRNTFNGITTPLMDIKDWKKH